MRRMEVSSAVAPSDGWAIIRAATDVPDDVVGLEVGPVVFNVPVRANSGLSDLYVVVEGRIVFEGDMRADILTTRTFGTRIGYFHLDAGTLNHVYGAHYDMDEVHAGHPVFHAQISEQMALGEPVKAQLGIESEIARSMGVFLNNVRTPSAQMDFFAVMTQVCADHLLGAGSSADAKNAFGVLRNASDFFVGAAHRLEYLNAAPAPRCYRSKHWYDSPSANAP